MPKINFRGKDYNSLADMPAKVRHDYFKARAGYDVSEEETQSKAETLPGGMENMPDQVREIYQRVRGELDARPIKSSPIDELPKTEDLYRRSAAEGVQNQPSDEMIYKPSPPIIEPPPPIVESDYTLRKLLIALAAVLVFLGIFLAIFFLG